MSTKALLPALPEPVAWRDAIEHCDLYWRKPTDVLEVDPLFTADQVRAIQLEAWRAAMEAAAKECDRVRAVSAVSYETGACCATAIRSLPDPE